VGLITVVTDDHVLVRDHPRICGVVARIVEHLEAPVTTPEPAPLLSTSVEAPTDEIPKIVDAVHHGLTSGWNAWQWQIDCGEAAMAREKVPVIGSSGICPAPDDVAARVDAPALVKTAPG